MTRFALYIDEDSQARALEAALRAVGIEVNSSGPHGMDGSTDAAQLTFATRRGWVVYTSNLRDYAVLHRDWLNAGESHAGIICHPRRRFSVGEQARRIVRIWRALSDEEMVNRYETLSQWGDDSPVPAIPG